MIRDVIIMRHKMVTLANLEHEMRTGFVINLGASMVRRSISIVKSNPELNYLFWTTLETSREFSNLDGFFLYSVDRSRSILLLEQFLTTFNKIKVVDGTKTLYSVQVTGYGIYTVSKFHIPTRASLSSDMEFTDGIYSISGNLNTV